MVVARSAQRRRRAACPGRGGPAWSSWSWWCRRRGRSPPPCRLGSRSRWCPPHAGPVERSRARYSTKFPPSTEFHGGTHWENSLGIIRVAFCQYLSCHFARRVVAFCQGGTGILLGGGGNLPVPRTALALTIRRAACWCCRASSQRSRRRLRAGSCLGRLRVGPRDFLRGWRTASR